MLRIKFKYKDQLSHDNWNEQECIVESVEECKRIYGLDEDPDCEYVILSVENA